MNPDYILKKVTDLTLYTGNNGRAKCSCNCPGCTQTNYGNRNSSSRHQGTLPQIEEIIEILPNLLNAYFLGNPDCSVDTTFCRDSAKLFIRNGKNVMFSTSGIGGLDTFKVLFDDIDISCVKYVSFSINSMNGDTERLLKGGNIDLKTVLQGIEYCLMLNIPVKIQPTLWQINQYDYKDIINFFYSMYHINWYTFHCGSLEGIPNNYSRLCHHIKPDVWTSIISDLTQIGIEKNLQMQIPQIFLEETDYHAYLKEYKNYCMYGGVGAQIWMEKELKCTFCPMLGEIYPDIFSFNPTFATEIKFTNSNICPITKFLLGKDLANEFSSGKWISETGNIFYPVCRFYSQKINL